MHQVRSFPQNRDPGDPGQDRQKGYGGERAAPAGELERKAGDAEADRVARARAGDEKSHRAAAPRALDVVVDERERRRVRPPWQRPGERVQPEGRPETVGEKNERPRARAGGDARRDVGALRAVMVGDEADDEERREVPEVERRLDEAGLLGRQSPFGLRERAAPRSRRRTRWPRGRGSRTAQRAIRRSPEMGRSTFPEKRFSVGDEPGCAAGRRACRTSGSGRRCARRNAGRRPHPSAGSRGCRTSRARSARGGGGGTGGGCCCRCRCRRSAGLGERDLARARERRGGVARCRSSCSRGGTP